MKQVRIAIDKLPETLSALVDGSRKFVDIKWNGLTLVNFSISRT
jgi:hypothetical protein